MPDLFDNFFNKIGTAINGKSNQHYLGSSQVNSGSFYSYHSSGTNNAYWLPTKKPQKKAEDLLMNQESQPIERQRMSSIISIGSENDDLPRSRMNSVSSDT